MRFVVFLAFQQIVIYEQNVMMLWMAVFIHEGGQITTPRTFMEYERVCRYSDKQNRVRNLNTHSSVIFPTNRGVNR